MPVDLNSLKEGWLELESDPGLFTLLLEDFGVRGVQVEEIYDLQKPIEGPVYGFIFLFKWIEERRSRRKVAAPDESFIQDEERVNSIFFAHQIVPNSCATHALLSVLLNCNKIHLGDTLARLKEYTKNMSPENKGYAIGNTPELAKAHNSHAKPEPRRLHEKTHGITTGRTVEAFHFVSYVPIAGQLIELDGLKPYPINHGPWDSHEDWTEKFRRVITERLGIATGDEPYHDIRFNLMAVVPDRRIAYEHKLQTLKTNRQIVLEALQQLVKMTIPELTSDDQAEYMAAVIRSKEQNNSLAFAEKPKLRNEANVSDVATTTTNTTDASGSDYTSDEDNENKGAHQVVSSSSSRVSERALAMPIHVNTKDYSHPLSIQTKFEASPTPSNSSTDTSSEVGSAFNSPVRTLAVGSTQNSPNFTMARDIKKFVVIRMTSDKESSVEERTIQQCDANRSLKAPTATPLVIVSKGNDGDVSNEGKHYDLKRQISSKILDVEPLVKRGCSVSSVSDNMSTKTAPDEGESTSDVPRLSSAKQDNAEVPRWDDNKRDVSRYPKLIEPHSFAPKDLLALLKNVENEIAVCENNLHEEIEKRKKYKVDDCRRTHNYDIFICTFAKMLAQQGMLADLVRHNVLVKSRQGINIGRLHKKADRRRRARPKKRK